MKEYQNKYGATTKQRQLIFPSRIAEISVRYSRKISDLDRVQITDSNDAVDVLRSKWKKNRIQYQEEFKVILLDRSNRVLGIHNAAMGGQSGCVVDPKVIFGVPLKACAAAILISHNHPSGNTKPSSADHTITQKLKAAGQLLDIPVIDHVILTKSDYFSFADNGVL